MDGYIKTEITDMNENGVGIAKVDGCIVFAEGGVTGDVCHFTITERKKNYAIGRIEELLAPSPLRSESKCDFCEQCGGCTLHHITFEAENQCKRQTVANAFRRAGLRTVSVRETLYTEEMGYRNKAVLHCGEINGQPQFGYFSEKTHTVTASNPCVLLPRRFNELVQFVNRMLPDYDSIGFDFLYLRTAVSGDISVELGLARKGNVDGLMHSSFLPALVGAFPEITGILAKVDGRTSLLYGEKELTDELGGLRFRVSPEGFWQVNNTAAERLAETVLRYASAVDFDVGIDLYCGSGTFGLLLARAFREKTYYGVELNPDSVADAKRNSALNGLGNISFFCGDAAAFREKLGEGALPSSLVVVDPPRAGCSREMLANLIALGAENVIYVSCNPGTLVRDCAKLAEAGYTVVEATPVNLFPRTKHIETVVLLSKGEIDSKKVRVEFSLEGMDMSGFQKDATYGQIKERVLE